jgi:hypothetical protein
MPMLTPMLTPPAMAALDAPNAITPITSGTKRADFMDYPWKNVLLAEI